MTFSQMLEVLEGASKALAEIGWEYRLEAQSSEQTDLVLTSHGYQKRDAPADEDGDAEQSAKPYPYTSGPHLIIGPECFTGDGDEVPQDVIMWRGAAYRLERHEDADQAYREAGE